MYIYDLIKKFLDVNDPKLNIENQIESLIHFAFQKQALSKAMASGTTETRIAPTALDVGPMTVIILGNALSRRTNSVIANLLVNKHQPLQHHHKHQLLQQLRLSELQQRHLIFAMNKIMFNTISTMIFNSVMTRMMSSRTKMINLCKMLQLLNSQWYRLVVARHQRPCAITPSDARWDPRSIVKMAGSVGFFATLRTPWRPTPIPIPITNKSNFVASKSQSPNVSILLRATNNFAKCCSLYNRLKFFDQS